MTDSPDEADAATESEPVIKSRPPVDPDGFPNEGALLGIDYGTKRLGFAVANPDQTIASGVENFTRQNPQVDAEKIVALCRDYRIRGLVVGLPVHMSGDESTKSTQCRRFGRQASAITGLPVRYWDERHTSMMAETILMSAELTKKRRKARTDMLAAQLMLQDYLDADDRAAGPVSLLKD